MDLRRSSSRRLRALRQSDEQGRNSLRAYNRNCIRKKLTAAIREPLRVRRKQGLNCSDIPGSDAAQELLEL